ncbi:MAG: glycosyltransferase [Actinomycetota bacterium]
MSRAGVRRILVDGRPVDHPTTRQRGIGRYTAGFLAGLAHTGVPVTAAVSSGVEADVLRASAPNLDVQPWSPELVRTVAADGGWYVATQLMLHPVSLDPIPRAVTQARLPVAAVMYDVIPHRYPSRYLLDPAARRLADVRSRLARTVVGMLAISEFSARTAAEALEYPLDRIRVIGAGVDPGFTPTSDDTCTRLERVARMGVRPRRRMVGAVTGGDERKNTEGLLRAWSLLDASIRESSQLVVACGVGRAVLDRWRHLAGQCGLEVGDDVVFTDSVSDYEMVALLQASALAVFPSFDEGFGLPVAEAAACGRPVICSDTASLPEVIDCDEALFDPYDPRAMARAIEWALEDDAHYERLCEAANRARTRWTWERVGLDTIDALAHFSQPIRPRVGVVPPRVGFVAPGADSPSGIGPYSESVARAWNSNAGELTRFVDSSTSDSRPPNGTWSAAAIGRYVPFHDLDEMLVALGSSPYHRASVAVAETFPVHAWLHEASLVGCHVGVAHLSGNESWARSMIAERVGAHASAHVALLDADEHHRRGVTVLEPVRRSAASVIVSSRTAADEVLRIDGSAPPILVLPLAFPAIEPVVDVPARSIVSAGWIDHNKRPGVLVRVAALLGVDLTFVGGVHGDAGDHIDQLATDLGVRDRVHVTGRLTDTEFDRHLRSHRVAVQLRSDASGQMSAAVNDLVARGIPVITSMRTHAIIADGGLDVVDIDELPDDRAARVVTESIRPLLDDDEAWRRASAAAREQARTWGFGDVANRLAAWLTDYSSRPPGSVEIAGPR